MPKYIRNMIDYNAGFQAGYLHCSQVAHDEPCNYANPTNSFEEGFIDGWDDCNTDYLEIELDDDDD